MRDPDRSWQPFSVLLAGPAPGSSSTTVGAGSSIEQTLEASGYAVIRSEGCEETVEVACAARPDAVVLGSPAVDEVGIGVARRLGGDPRFPATTPIILVTTVPAPEAEEAAFRAGVWDVCAGPRAERALVAKLRTFVRARLVSERLRAGSMLDGETDAYTAAGLGVRSLEIEAAAGRAGEPLSCVMLHFTLDDAGNDGGEFAAPGALAQAVQACRKLTRASDVLARLGPTEFALIAPGADVVGASALTSRLVRYFDRRRGCTLRAAAHSTPVFVPEAQSVESLLAEARAVLRESRPQLVPVSVPDNAYEAAVSELAPPPPLLPRV